MPSHAAHLLFALEVLAEETSPRVENIEAFNCGAQLPDVFYHNRRTNPSGLYISVAMHRRGFALLFSHILSNATNLEQTQTAFAFLSHGVLDRFMHPWINAFTGWYDPAKAGSLGYRFQHPLCERMIDLWICTRQNASWLLGPEFSQHWARPGKEYLQNFGTLLSEIYPRCKNDTDLAIRLENAFGDCTGYYRWSSSIDTAAYHEGFMEAKKAWNQRKENGEQEELESAFRFASLVHPRFAASIEESSRFLGSFFENRELVWTDPCHDRVESHWSLGDVWSNAHSELRRLIEILGIDLRKNFAAEGWLGQSNKPDQSEIHDLLIRNGFHDGDLRSRNQSDQGCDMNYCKPIDWFKVWFELESLKDD